MTFTNLRTLRLNTTDVNSFKFAVFIHRCPLTDPNIVVCFRDHVLPGSGLSHN
jgi:hypothetical protein